MPEDMDYDDKLELSQLLTKLDSWLRYDVKSGELPIYRTTMPQYRQTDGDFTTEQSYYKLKRLVEEKSEAIEKAKAFLELHRK